MSDDTDRDTPPEGGDRPFWSPADRTLRPPVEGEDGALHCGYCEAVLAEDQTYCLECGAPTPMAPRIRRDRAAALIAAGLVVLGIGAGVLAFVVAGDDDDQGGVTTTALTIPPAGDAGAPTLPTSSLPADTTFTTPSPTDPATVTESFPTDTTATGTVTAPDPGQTFETVTGTAPVPPETVETTTGEPIVPVPTTDETPPATGADEWPAGTTAWTAILSSVRNEADARAAADALVADGEQAGVMISDDHPEFRPGFYVVFSGVFDARQAAIDQAARLAGRFPGAYARQISG